MSSGINKDIKMEEVNSRSRLKRIAAMKEEPMPEFDATTPTVVQDAQQVTHTFKVDYLRSLVVQDDNRANTNGFAEALLDSILAERDALLAEHEALAALKRFVLENAADAYSSPRTEVLATCMENAHDNAERVIRGE